MDAPDVADATTKRRPIVSYRDLDVWQLGMDLAVACYELARCLPKGETFGLSAQLRRSSASIPANVAEGWGRQSRSDFVRFLHIAQGSLKETETHLLLAVRVKLLEHAQILPALELADRLGRALAGYVRSLQAAPPG